MQVFSIPPLSFSPRCYPTPTLLVTTSLSQPVYPPHPFLREEFDNLGVPLKSIFIGIFCFAIFSSFFHQGCPDMALPFFHTFAV